MKSISLRNLVVYYTVFLFFIPIAIIGLSSIITVFKTTEKFLIDKNSLLLENISTNIEEKAKHSVRELEFLELYIKEKKIFTDNKKAYLKDLDLNNIVLSILNDKNCFETIGIYDKTLNLLYDRSIINNNSISKYLKNNYLNKLISVQKKEIEFSLIMDENDSVKASIYYPIFINGDLYCAIYGVIIVEEVIDNINNKVKLNKKIELNILNESNEIISSLDKVDYGEILKILKIDDFNKLNIIKTKNISKIVFFKNIDRVNWKVILTQDISEAFKIANILRTIIVMYFIVGLIGTIFTLIFGYIIIFKPLINISYLTAKIAHSDYDFSFKNSFIKELNILMQNFKRMIKKILRKEKELIDSELKYRKIVEESLDFFFKVSDKMKFSYISSSIEKAIGYTASEFTRDFTKHLRTNSSNRNIIVVSKKIFETKKIPEPFVFEIINKLGEQNFLEIQLTPIVEDGVVVEIQGSARNITLRYNAQKETVLKKYLYTIIDAMPSAVITLDSLGFINQFNRAHKSIINLKMKRLRKDFMAYF